MKNEPSYTFKPKGKNQNGKTVRVSMLDLAGKKLDGSRIEMGRGFIYEPPPKRFDSPITTVGTMCPASFTVDGLDDDVTFSIGIAPSKRHKKYPDQHDIVITSITSTLNDFDSLKKIPTRELIAAAIRAAGVIVLHYVADNNGKAFGYTDEDELVPIEGMHITTDKDGHREVVAYRIADENAAYMYAGVPDVVSPDQRLRDVAKIVKQHPYGYTREVSQRIGVTERHAGRLIYDARQAGYLPPSTRKAPK
jgi:hypothetical protein